jgi:hypothetical protein
MRGACARACDSRLSGDSHRLADSLANLGDSLANLGDSFGNFWRLTDGSPINHRMVEKPVLKVVKLGRRVGFFQNAHCIEPTAP